MRNNNMLINIKKAFSGIFFMLVILTICVLMLPGIRGTNQDPTYYQLTRNREVGGPFESSGSTSRYVLTESIVKNKSVILSKTDAQFASPDVAKSNNQYFSLFLPGVSFLAVPLYAVGESLGYAQIATFTLNMFLGVINLLLITLIVRKITGGIWTGLFSGVVFLFGTNAFSYSFFLTQHHTSILCTLILIYLLLRPASLISNTIAGLTFGFGLITDLPNAIILMPGLIAIIYRNIGIQKTNSQYSVTLKLGFIGLLLGLLPMLFALGTYNKSLTGSPLLLPQFVGRSTDFNAIKEDKPEQMQTKFDHIAPFFSRFTANGMYILLISNERGILYYSPVVAIGLLGLLIGLRERKNFIMQIVLSMILLNVLLYAMFGDPWGGWSFGPRYLLPTSAMLSIMVGYAIYKLKHSLLFTLILLPLVIYSIYISTLGAVTSNQIPPKQEAVNLTTHTSYTYAYNIDLINNNQTRSFLFTSMLKDKMTVRQFYFYYATLLLALAIGVYTFAMFEKPNDYEDK